MPPERTARPRQDPVSCRLCRTKRLKCNREQPCSNWVARGASCELQTRLPPNRDRHEPVVASENASILARLQRLEDLVLESGRTEPPPFTSQQQRSQQSVAASQTSEQEEAHKADAEWLESVGLCEQSLVSASVAQ